MDEKSLAVIKRGLERTKPLNMVRRNISSTGGTITAKRHVPTIQSPIIRIAVVLNGPQSESFVVSHETDRVCSEPRLEIHHVFNNAAALGSSVYIVTDEDELHRPPSRVALASRHETVQLAERAMNITDGINPLRQL